MTSKFNVYGISIGNAQTADIDNLPDAETVAKVLSRGDEDRDAKPLLIMEGGKICSLVIDGVMYHPEPQKD